MKLLKHMGCRGSDSGKVLHEKESNLEVVANTLKSALKTELSFEVRDLGENKAIFFYLRTRQIWFVL